MISVTVYKPADRKYYLARWTDPDTGKQRKRSTKETRRRDAERFASDLEESLNLGRDAVAVSWPAFLTRYETEHLSSLAERTEAKSRSVLSMIGEFGGLQTVQQITAKLISQWAASMRKQGRAEDTISGNLAYLRTALQWACDQEIISGVPKFPKVKRKKKTTGKSPMKGRPITAEEFDRYVDAVSGISSRDLDSWEFLIRSLWLSGLRLNEAVNLSWDDQDRMIPLIDRKRPVFQVPGEAEKGHQDRLLPMAPEFAEFLSTVPEEGRKGFVFNPSLKQQKLKRLGLDRVSKVLVLVGERSGVVVNRSGGKVKYASAHDLRRSFGSRWASRVMPAILQKIMRHESIETTMRYYVSQQAEDVADILWKHHNTTDGPTFGPTSDDTTVGESL